MGRARSPADRRALGRGALVSRRPPIIGSSARSATFSSARLSDGGALSKSSSRLWEYVVNPRSTRCLRRCLCSSWLRCLVGDQRTDDLLATARTQKPTQIMAYLPRTLCWPVRAAWSVQVIPAPRGSRAPVGLAPEPVPHLMPGLQAEETKRAFRRQPIYQRPSLLVCACPPQGPQ
jgi:hypothetical protein